MKLEELEQQLSAMLEDEAPIKIEQGGVFKSGVNKELDEWRSISKGGKDWLLEYQQKLIKETGISTLKIKFNRVFGYFVEVSAGQKENVPDYFIRKQTLTNAERFTTEELMEYQGKVLKAEEEILRIETQMFDSLCEEVVSSAEPLQELADEIAGIDVLSSFAELAVNNKYCKPELVEENILDVEEGRHPVIETLTDQFISNDISLSESMKFILLSGPNMAGKSTYLRQNALIIYLAHIGCFVAASSAKIGLVDQIFTRVGAGDNLSSGESTFMMEMLEASTILHNATERSFIILDELGRGTSTFDGLSLAWAMSEHIHNKLEAKCIFATHYHELIEPVDEMERAKNLSVAVLENESQGVVFLHKIVEGGADKSYGIEVARLAGVPQNILKRAKTILCQLEEKRHKQEQALQMSLFDNPVKQSAKNQVEKKEKSELEKKLEGIDVNNMSPMEALQFIITLQNLLKA